MLSNICLNNEATSINLFFMLILGSQQIFYSELQNSGRQAGGISKILPMTFFSHVLSLAQKVL